MKSNQIQTQWFNLLLLAIGLALFSGCAVLTKSQVKEVNAFAEASKKYGDLPGGPIRAYGDARRADRLLNVSARDYSDEKAQKQGWEEIVKANELEDSYKSAADEVDATLDVLNTYSDLLVVLSSDQFTDSLDASAKSLGDAMDKAVNTYNQTVLTPQGKPDLGLIGKPVAAAVRGAGGIWLRHRQAEYLKRYVTAAQPIIQSVTLQIQDLMTNTMTGYFDKLEARTSKDFITAVGRAKRISFETAESMADAQRQISAARELCVSAAQAAHNYALAHTKLFEALKRRQTLKTQIEEIKVMAEEIKKAQKLQKQIKQ
jgi:hypothetical protein